MHPAIVQTPVEACRPRLQSDYKLSDAESEKTKATLPLIKLGQIA
jgi:hypothetical protein